MKSDYFEMVKSDHMESGCHKSLTSTVYPLPGAGRRIAIISASFAPLPREEAALDKGPRDDYLIN